MDERAWQRVKDVFRSAVEVDPAARTEVLDAVDDPAVRTEVEALLRAHDEAGPARGSGAVPDAGEAPGTVIGRYRLQQKIGEGGFGVVYMAEQLEPVRRQVALKIIKRGMDTKQVVARFEAERQALALMNHPNIAKVHDGGSTEAGRPYFVLELVRGIPITEYCDQAGLDTRERLELFRTVCQAVQHAHQKGIIHRDLKPANVLVTLHDGQPVPKVIDFGIAKATDRHLTERTLFTEFWQIVGTPDYMAPEQAEISGLDIDTRADVYSLGVLLYELLTGTKPFDLRTLLEKGYEELLRTIREVDPPPPSSRLTAMREDLAVVAQQRHTPPRLLGRLVRGDLDWIVMRALEKDRSRRYGTASAMAEDVQRHLEDRPVLATPPSALDRVRKYVRRHRAGTVATVAVLLALVTGLVLAVLGLAEARRQAEAAGRAEEEARREADRATTAMGMLDEMLSVPDRVLGRGPQITVRLMLEDFERDLAERVRGRPDVEVPVRITLSTAWHGLGFLDRAEEHIRIALDLAERELGRDHVLYAEALANRGMLVRSRGRLVEAEEIQRRAVALFRNADRADPIELASVVGNLGTLLLDQGQVAEAEALAREALDLRRRHLGEDHPDTAVSLSKLSRALRLRGDYAGAERLDRQSLEIRTRVHGEDHPAVAKGRHNLAILLLDLRRLDEAEEAFERALAARRRILGADHPETLSSLDGLARLRLAQRRPAEAEALLRRCLEGRRRVLGEESPGVLFALTGLAEARIRQNDLDEAQRLLDEALALSRRIYGPRSHQTGALIGNLGILSWRREDLDRAETLLRESLDIRRVTLGEDHPETALSAGSLSMILAVRGDHAAAVPLARRAFETWRSRLGETSERTVKGGVALATSLSLAGDHAEAEEVARSLLETGEPSERPRSSLLALLGAALLEQDRPAEAEAPLRESLDLRIRSRPDHWLRWSVAGDLGACLAGQEKFAEAEPLLIDAYENMKPPPSLAHRRAEALERVVALYEAWGKPEKAAVWREKTSDE